ncbi:MAG: trypsin-like peptidase domain-containing protein [Mycobacteriales bacterium]
MTRSPEGYGPRPPWGYPDEPGQQPYYSPWASPYPPVHDASRLPSEQPGRSYRLAATIAVGILTAAVIGGGVGALAGHREASRETTAPAVADLTVPQAVLPVTGPTLPPARAPGSVAAIAAAVVPSVVTIQVRSDTEQATGSGVVLRSDGYIVTNNHVVAPALSDGGKLTVDLSATDTGVPAQVVGRSPSDDLAVIKIARTDLRAARLGHSSSLQVGDEVVAIGAPLGLSGSVSEGIVSALNRNVDVPEEGASQKATVLGNAIQTDAAINPGNSGGALVDATGAVVGINSAIASLGSADGSGSQTGSIGVGFAIPVDYVVSVATEIIRTGTVTHPYIGISLTTIDPDTAGPGGPQAGAVIRSIVAGSPASRSDLRVGDVIVGIGTTVVRSADDLIVATRSYATGQAVTLKVIRGGRTLPVRVVLGENPNG